ncbi:MAG: hypothetical protein LBR92_03660 [Puniceicoccales bacterium]|nr:hypothetical protein [Puniceicoccales bacterium]
MKELGNSFETMAEIFECTLKECKKQYNALLAKRMAYGLSQPDMKPRKAQPMENTLRMTKLLYFQFPEKVALVTLLTKLGLEAHTIALYFGISPDTCARRISDLHKNISKSIPQLQFNPKDASRQFAMLSNEQQEELFARPEFAQLKPKYKKILFSALSPERKAILQALLQERE